MDYYGIDVMMLAKFMDLQKKTQEARLAYEEAVKEEVRVTEQIRRGAEERARREKAARLAEEEAARLAEEEVARAPHAAKQQARRKKATRQKAAEEAAQLLKAQAVAVLQERDRLAAKEKAKVRTVAMQQEPHAARSSNRNLQAVVATSFVKSMRMHMFDSKGVEANDESGHWSDGGLSDDVIMADPETTVSTSLLAFTRKLKTILAREKGQETHETAP
jgi:hypothetical protein